MSVLTHKIIRFYESTRKFDNHGPTIPSKAHHLWNFNGGKNQKVKKRAKKKEIDRKKPQSIILVFEYSATLDRVGIVLNIGGSYWLRGGW